MATGHDGDDQQPGRGGAHAAGTRPPAFPRVPTVRRRPRARRTLSTIVIAGLAGGIVGVAAFRLAPGSVTPAPAPSPLASSVASSGPQAEMARGTVARVAEAVLPSVVRINRATTDRFESTGNGSGVVYRADGLIITNNHVVAEPGGIEVVFADGRSIPAEIVGQDQVNDLAVIKVERDDLHPIQLGSTRSARVGDLAIAVGSPFGLDATVTVGVISAVGRGIHAGNGTGTATVYLPEVLQTDAPMNPGNSGGALVDGHGRLIGINSAILTSGQAANGGVGFAIPVDTVVDVAEELIASGRVRHPLLGVSGGPVPAQVAERLGVSSGAWIHDVTPGTPAAGAGLAPDDVIVRIGERPIRSMEELSIAVRDLEVGVRVQIAYVRAGDRRTVEVVLAERGAGDPQ